MLPSVCGRRGAPSGCRATRASLPCSRGVGASTPEPTEPLPTHVRGDVTTAGGVHRYQCSPMSTCGVQHLCTIETSPPSHVCLSHPHLVDVLRPSPPGTERTSSMAHGPVTSDRPGADDPPRGRLDSFPLSTHCDFLHTPRKGARRITGCIVGSCAERLQHHHCPTATNCPAAPAGPIPPVPLPSRPFPVLGDA
jgi:hypothetical protein